MNLIDNLKENIELINKNFKGGNLNKIQQLTGYDFLLSFSKGKNANLLLSVNIKNPFIKITNDKFLINQNDNFTQHLKTKLLSAYFEGAKLLNDDNILGLYFERTNATYDKIKYVLIVELFKSNANIILVSNNKINDAFRFKGLDTNHPILNDLIYTYPERTNAIKEFTEKDQEAQEAYYTSINTIYLKEKYAKLISLLKRKQKSLSKKLVKLQEEQKIANEKSIYKDYGDYLKMHFNDVKRGDTELVVDEYTIPLNKEFSPSQNLQYFYKIYKKSKATIEMSNKYLVQTQNEIQYLDNILSIIDLYTEDEYEELIKELVNNKLIKINVKKISKTPESAKKPYYVTYDNVRFGYGKNNIQNDELTFNIAQKEDIFLHINKAHGPHIIIFKKDPTDDEIEFACELALYLAKVSDGDVIFSKVMYLKKTSNIGQVRMSKYETYHINKIRDTMKDYVAKSCRF